MCGLLSDEILQCINGVDLLVTGGGVHGALLFQFQKPWQFIANRIVICFAVCVLLMSHQLLIDVIRFCESGADCHRSILLKLFLVSKIISQ